MLGCVQACVSTVKLLTFEAGGDDDLADFTSSGAPSVTFFAATDAAVVAPIGSGLARR